MAYDPKDLSVLAYANGFTLWHYTTPDSTAAVAASGYFNVAADMVRVGDLIITITDTSGTTTADISVVRTNAAGTVVTQNIGT